MKNDKYDFSKQKIMVIGDVMLDRYVYGNVLRLSPESIAPVLKESETVIKLGGSGNLAANLVSLGAKTTIVGLCGLDSEAETMKNLLAGCKNTYLIEDATRPTIIKTRYVGQGNQHLLRVDAEMTHFPSDTVRTKLLKAVDKEIKKQNVVILSDYAKGTLSNEVISHVISLAKKYDVPVFVDPKGKDFGKYDGAFVLTPNLGEFASLIGNDISGDDAIERAGTKWLKAHSFSNVIITRDAQGATLIARNGDVIHANEFYGTAVDVAGAGDSFLAGLAVSYAQTQDMGRAVKFANMVGGLAVLQRNTSIISIGDIMDFENKGNEQRKAFYSLDEVVAQVKEWRAQGLVVGFTNGCFDILHCGHVSYLDKAKAQCDRLVLGLNSDASVQRLKGPTRPVNDETARGVVMSGLRSVDAVVYFGDDPAEGDTPLNLIKAVAPDVLVKGADYTIDKVVGADFVQARGGRVYLAPLEEGFSTTKTIEKMRA